MPTPSAPRHQWTLSFDRICCRECGAGKEGERKPCRGSKKIRPMATVRQQQQKQRGEHESR